MTTRPRFGSFVSGQDVVGESSLENSYARYTYNNFNQMVAAQTGDARSEYKYNGAGVRTYKEVGGVKTYYMYQGLKAIYEVEVDGLTRDASVNMYAGNKLVSVFASGTETKLLYDGLGSVVGYYDVGVNDYGDYRTYNAFGELEENGIANDTLDIGYRGYQLDSETELYNLNARMYDADLARFMQEDTYLGKASDPLSLNLYAYVSYNPLRYWDPTGRILSEWDKDHLTKDEMELINYYTEEWNIGHLVGDTRAKVEAHTQAERIRNKYRNYNEVGFGDGYTYEVEIKVGVKPTVKAKINKKDKKSATSGHYHAPTVVKDVASITKAIKDTKSFGTNHKKYEDVDLNKSSDSINRKVNELSNGEIEELSGDQRKALSKIVDTYWNDEVIYEDLNQTQIYFFEGAGIDEGNRYSNSEHGNERYKAMGVVVKNKKIVFASSEVSTLPDHPKGPKKYNTSKTGSSNMPTLEDGIHFFEDKLHGGNYPHPALHIYSEKDDTSNATVQRFSDELQKYERKTSSGINVHMGNRNASPNETDAPVGQYWSNSAGCQIVRPGKNVETGLYDRYNSFASAVGFDIDGNVQKYEKPDDVSGVFVVDRSLLLKPSVFSHYNNIYTEDDIVTLMGNNN